MSFTHCNNQKNTKKQIMVFAGMGMKNAVVEIMDAFNIQHPDVKVVSNWAASGTLAKQTSQGNVPDVFISANKKWVNYIDSLGLIVANKKMLVATNELVVIAHKDCKVDSINFSNASELENIVANSFLSIGDPNYVPAGAYAKQSLKYYNLYASVESKIVPAKDVRSALWAVEVGEATAGIVFRSEALASNKVKILAVIPPESHKPITFIATQCKNNTLSDTFYQFLDTEKARNIWVKHGFY